MDKLKGHFCDHCDDYCEVVVMDREGVYEYKDEKITVEEKYLVCAGCGHEVYDEDLGDETLKNLRKKYYEIKYNMGVDDFKDLRNHYNLNQILFAKVLNWSESTIKRYETGASLPDSTHIAIYKILKNNPSSIINFYEETKGNLSNEEHSQVKLALKDYLALKREEMSVYALLRHIYDNGELNEKNGYTKFHELKLINMVIYFANQGVLKTKLMKLLWYADFLMYKKYQKSISGISYMKLQYGPVPKKFNTMLGALESINKIDIYEEDDRYFTGYTKITILAKSEVNISIFTKEELQVLSNVNDFFGSFGAKQIADYSHSEKGWIDTHDFQEISYKYAEELTI